MQHVPRVAELPEVRPDVVKYRLHRLDCPRCNKPIRAALSPGVPAGAFGPRLVTTVGLWSGCSHLSKSLARVALADLLRRSVSVGMASARPSVERADDGRASRHLLGPERR